MISIIIPPSPFLLDEKVFVALGPLYVAAVLENKGFDVQVVDLKGVKDWVSVVRSIASHDNRLIGVSSTTPDFPISLKILEEIKSVNPNIEVAIGGCHATIAPDQCTKFDKIIVGDGVTGIFNALNSNEKVIHSEMLKNLDELPFPARHLIAMSSYHYEINGRRATNVMSQWGCPYNCAFCCGRNVPEYRTVRYRSPANFISELDYLNSEYGYKAFMLHDDEFNLKKSRTIEICEALRKRDYKFRGFIRTDLFTEEIAAAMAQAGFFQIDVGVESGSQRILDTIEKQTTPEMNSEARRLAKKYGLFFKAFLTVGHPGETREDIELTKRWLLDNKPDAFEIYTITPYPGSNLFDHKDKYDFDFKIDYLSDAASVTRRYGEYQCNVWNSKLSSSEIAYLREKVDKEVREQLGLRTTEVLSREMRDSSKKLKSNSEF